MKIDFRATLGGMDPRVFLRDYWQKKPLLIRQAFPDFQGTLDPDELAGLACEEEVESRIIEAPTAGDSWRLRRGPFTGNDFASLGASHWTLLVQEVDHLLPELADLRQHFRFIPDWRLDDIMVSYSVAGGSVGPHVDNYDVFLLQAKGARRWEVGMSPVASPEALVPGQDLRILKDFHGDASWLLQAGDMLYLPPRFAHWGTALEPGFTYSVGFRSPSQADMLASFTDHCLGAWEENDRYGDKDLTLQGHPGEISAAAVANVSAWLRSLPIHEQDIAHWFGRLVTSLPEGGQTNAQAHFSDELLNEYVQKGGSLRRDGAARLAFMYIGEGLTLFANGGEYLLPLEAAPAVKFLTQTYELSAMALTPLLADYGKLIAELVRQDIFYLQDEEAEA